MSVDFYLIKRYLDGNGQKEDKEKILSWFSDYMEEDNLQKQYNRYWNELPYDLNIKGYDEERMLGKIYHEIKLDETRLLVKRKIAHRFFNLITRIAAILFIPLTIYIYINKERYTLNEAEISYSEIYAPNGTRTMFYLPDGSSGCLNGGSTVKFPTTFKGKFRDVSLKGEAFFDIRNNPQKPFVVTGANIKVVALGTAFNVDAYPEDKINKVTLVRGKVKVESNKDGSIQNLGILEPGQMCLYDMGTSSYKLIDVDTDKIISWKEGKLAFINEPFDEVIKKLNRRYNSNIVIKEEKLRKYSYLATFEDETLDEIINLLKISAPIEVKDLGRERKPDGTFEKRTIEIYYKAKT